MTEKRNPVQIEACLSEYRMDRHFFGLETTEEYECSKAHIASCKRCQADLHALERAQAHAADIVIPSTPSQAPWQIWWEWLIRPPVWGTTLVACGFLLFFSTGNWSAWLTGTPPKQHRFSTKSGRQLPRPSLLIVRKRGTHVLHVRSEEVFRAGDFIRIGYRWAYPGYIHILHRDAQGEVSPLYPSSKDARSLRASGRGEKWFSGSLEVEGKPQGDEEIWACFSKTKHSFDDILKVLPRRGKDVKREKELLDRKNAKGAIVCEYLLHFVLKRL